jgi:hypothetical protein
MLKRWLMFPWVIGGCIGFILIYLFDPTYDHKANCTVFSDITNPGA